MFTLLITFILITAVLLILITALQSSKKEGVGNSLGSMGAHQIIGVKKTSDLLEQITWGLITSLFVLSLSTSLWLKKRNAGLPMSPNLERIQQEYSLIEPGQDQQDAANTQIQQDTNTNTPSK
jgi:preprotein translocase subunit SecG